MIDGIKFRLDTEAMRNNDVLLFSRKDERREIAEYQGMKIKLHTDSCYVSGSIHKYWNKGKHNANDFRLSSFIQALSDLSVTFGFNPCVTQFYTLEFGVNVALPFEPRRLIDSIVYCNNGALETNKIGLTISFSDFRIKIYLKEIKPAQMENNRLLRYEIAVEKKRKLAQIASSDVFCSTLQDLTNPALWRLLGNELLSVYDSLLVVDSDSIDIQSLDTDELKIYSDGIRPGYWLRDWRYREDKKRALKQFREIIDKHSQSTIKSDARALIEAKINSLIDVEFNETRNTDVTISPFGKLETGQNFVTISPFGKEKPNVKENQKCYECPTWITGENVTFQKPNLHFCEITNLPLETCFSPGSYLSSKGVEFYHDNRPEIYNEVLRPRLSKKWENADLKIQFREIAHSIRNEKYNPGNNPRNNAKKSIRNVLSKGSLLFSLAETISKEKRKYLS
jgi:hypothetical protein